MRLPRPDESGLVITEKKRIPTFMGMTYREIGKTQVGMWSRNILFKIVYLSYFIYFTFYL